MELKDPLEKLLVIYVNMSYQFLIIMVPMVRAGFKGYECLKVLNMLIQSQIS
jgi:hypothetical protein